MAKKTIHLTESELKTMIKEAVNKILTESQKYYTWDINVNMGDIMFEGDLDNFLEDMYENEMDVPESVSVVLEYEMEPYDAGDYWTPPSGGGCNIIDFEIDPSNEFKSIIPNALYEEFITVVSKYVNKNMESYCEQICKYHECDF